MNGRARRGRAWSAWRAAPARDESTVPPSRTLPSFFVHQRPDILCLAEVPVDEHGHSPAVEQIASLCGLSYWRVDLLHPSHVASEGGHLGLAMLSRFRITSSDCVMFTNLGLHGPNLICDDKGLQRVRVWLDGSGDCALDVFNTWLLPAHIFGRRMDDPAFDSLRRELTEAVYGAPAAGAVAPYPLRRTVVAGHLNNLKVPLGNAFPSLGIGHQLCEAVRARSTLLGPLDGQSDHILVSPDMRVRRRRVYWTTSDHPALVADLTLRPGHGSPG